jgi:hypothetical protein
MRISGANFIDNLRRLTSVLATLIFGVVFVMATSAYAAPPDKKIEVKDKVKIEKVEKIEEIEEIEEINEADPLAFNQGLFLDNLNIMINNNRINILPLFGRGRVSP